MLNYVGNLINDFASRLASSAAANTLVDVDSNGHISLGPMGGAGGGGGKKKKKKRRHR